MYQVWRENQARSFAVHFHHAATGSLTCCLATDCNNPQFTLTQLPLTQRVAGQICRCMIDRLILCVCVAVWQPMPCVYTYSVVLTVWYLFVVDCLSWTPRSSVFSTTVQTVAPHKTASPARSSWNMSPRWAPFTAVTAASTQHVLVYSFEHSVCVFACDARWCLWSMQRSATWMTFTPWRTSCSTSGGSIRQWESTPSHLL